MSLIEIGLAASKLRYFVSEGHVEKMGFLRRAFTGFVNVFRVLFGLPKISLIEECAKRSLNNLLRTEKPTTLIRGFKQGALGLNVMRAVQKVLLPKLIGDNLLQVFNEQRTTRLSFTPESYRDIPNALSALLGISFSGIELNRRGVLEEYNQDEAVNVQILGTNYEIPLELLRDMASNESRVVINGKPWRDLKQHVLEKDAKELAIHMILAACESVPGFKEKTELQRQVLIQNVIYGLYSFVQKFDMPLFLMTMHTTQYSGSVDELRFDLSLAEDGKIVSKTEGKALLGKPGEDKTYEMRWTRTLAIDQDDPDNDSLNVSFSPL